jgi:hypothetical protein
VLLTSLRCTRPVTGRDLSSTILTDLQVKPEYVKADVPLDISFLVTGAPPATVTYDIAGNTGTCSPMHQSDERWHCMHPGVNRQSYMEGPTLLVVETKDRNGKSSVVTHPITIDFECPHFLALSVTPPIAQPGDTAVVSVEANKPLGEPPVVSRAGTPWETGVGQDQMWTVTHMVTIADPQTNAPLVVRITDLAGNTSGDCGEDGMLKFLVDQTPPAVDIDKVTILRDVPGTPSTIKADPGAFVDDVAVTEVRIFDSSGMLMLASLKPLDDGSIPETSLGIQPKTRVLVSAIDPFGRTSPPLAVPETWRLSIGTGSSPNAGIRTASRVTAPPPTSLSMNNRTFDLAPAVFQADARSATVRTTIGFNAVGNLPTRYEDTHHIISGYEPVGKRVIAAGGCNGLNCNLFDAYVGDVTLLQWDETEGAYLPEQGPSLILAPSTSTIAPNPRFGYTIAPDGNGCAVLFGGDSLYLDSGGNRNSTIEGDVWRLCYAPAGYRWQRIPIAPTLPGNLTVSREAPIVYDPINKRYVTIGDAGIDNPKALFLVPDADPMRWQWIVVPGLPSALPDRFLSLLYYDARDQGIVSGLGFPQVQGSGEQLQYWTYADGQWTLTQVPPTLGFRAFFGWAYDSARQQLALWGGNTTQDTDPPDPDVWVLTGSSTNAMASWRNAPLDHPVARSYPSLVYDPDREVIVVFGGIRPSDMRAVPSEVDEIVLQPAAPFMLATVDLAADRPKGIAKLHLSIRASGVGDADGLKAGAAQAGGVIVKLWDFAKNVWTDVATTAGSSSGIEAIEIDIASTPDVYVGTNGTVPIAITTRHPSTEAVSGRLDVDLIDGHLDLKPGVSLP